MGHPDQHSPDQHRTSSQQRPPEPEAEQDLDDDLDDPALEADADTGPDVRAPEPDEKRQGEAGHTYTGREMNDRLKTNPRVEDADEVTGEDADED